MATRDKDEPKDEPTKPKKKPWALLSVVAVVLLVIGWIYATAPSHIVLEQGLEFTSVTSPEEVTPGGTLPLTFKLHATKPLASDMWFFIHIEAQTNSPNACRMVHDQPPTPPPTQWKDQEITHAVTVTVPPTCQAGRYEVYAGLYDRNTWARLKVLQPRTVDNRVHIGFVDVVKEGASTGTRTITPRGMALQEYRGLVQPWIPWLIGIGIAAAIAAYLHARRTAGDDDQDTASAMLPLDKRVRWVSWALPAVPFFLGILVVLEFVKDDAYISFRYAHNLVTGHGLVFNQGEKLEGFTNFLWVLILAPFEWLGWDLFQVCEVLGTILGIACLVQATRFVTWINGERKDFSQLWAAMWLATSSSFVLWAKSGLEQPLAQLLPIAGAWILWRARSELLLSETHVTRPVGIAQAPTKEGDAVVTKRLEKKYLIAGILMGMACMTRPELHMMAILVGLPLVLDAVKARKVTRAQLLYVAGILAITIPSHGFRYAYYGTLVPNTFYVKTGTGSLVWREGIKTLHDMFDFNDTGALVVLAPLAFADRKRIVEKSVMAIISLAFMAFYVKVGVDEMQWHRLYLPALPFTAVLAALGAQNLLDGVLRLAKSENLRTVAYGAGWGAVLLAGYQSFRFTYREQHGFDGHGDLAGTYHPDLGKFLVRHERPGALVAFQDMGSTPYHAPDIDFLDFIGLVDKTVAHARHDYGLHAFVGSDVDNNQGKYDAEMRDYYYKRNPEWAILTIYTPRGEEQRIARAFELDPGPNALGDTFNSNPYQFGIYADPRFRDRYVHVRTWQRSIGYYLSLWRRKDLWEQTPREVVLDAPPPGISGVKVKFENGLEIIGSDLTKETLERHEVFITTWWKLPGPMPADTVFFVHVSAPGFQAPGDHTPGDWMWPGDRWQADQILEDRTLFQLPPFTMKPGKYDVYIGVYRRGTGERLKIVEGPNDGQDRVLLGSFQVNHLQPLIHQLIPPTRIDIMRKYPDRIIDSHRPFGQ
jgi:arabinofuranosyltransferase